MGAGTNEELFRFVAVRPPVPAEPDEVVRLELSDERRAQLLQGAEPLTLAKDDVRALRHARRVLEPRTLTAAEEAQQILDDAGVNDVAAVRSAITEHLAVGIIRRDPSVPTAEYADLLRVFEALDEASAATARQGEPVLRALDRPLLLIDDSGADRPAPGDTDELKKVVDERRSSAKLVRDRFVKLATDARALRAAGEELTSLGPAAFADDADADEPDSSPKRDYDGVLQRVGRWLGILPDDELVSRAALAERAVAGLKLSSAAVDGLSTGTTDVLAKLGIDVAEQSLPDVLTRLDSEQRAVTAEAHQISGAEKPPLQDPLPMTAPTSETVSMYLSSSVWDPKAFDLGTATLPIALGQILAPRIRESGLGQLLVVRQQLVRYEAGEVAHIENILAGEFRERTHRRRHLTEETFLVERETATSESHSLETAERFEVSTESQSAVEEHKRLEGRLEVSGKYGPSVSFTASAAGTWSQSKEEAQKTASKFAREITETAERSVAENVRTKQTRRVVEELEETNIHRINNDIPGASHRSGVYQWVEKIYQAQIFDYGLRTLYDLVIPEPAAFVVAASLQAQSAPNPPMPKPVSFTLAPQNLDRANYDIYVARYHATDVEPPPARYAHIGTAFSFGNKKGWKDRRHTETGELVVPDGYKATRYALTGSTYGDSKSNFDVHIGPAGPRRFVLNGDGAKSGFLPGITGSVPVAVKAFRVSAFATTIELTCELTGAAFEDWQVDTHEKIRGAYHARLSEYEEALARVELQQSPQDEPIQGRNPNTNKRIAADEIKRAAITMLANQNLNLSAIVDDPSGIPLVDISAAQSQDPVIRFLEQAFEWEQLNYLLYPYLWGRRTPHWKRAILHDDVDPDFARFVRAGAARVQLAVRRGFESAVRYFLQRGVPWEAGPLPEIGDETYVPFAAEQAAQLGRPGDEEPFGEPWEVRVPTALVKLRDDDKLPEWIQQADGSWLPADSVVTTGGGP